MLQDIAPHVYHNPMEFRQPRQEDVALVCTKEGILLRREQEQWVLPKVGQVQGAEGFTYGFSIDETAYFLTISGEVPDFSFVRDYRGRTPKELVFACAVGQSLARWYQGNRFCGCCGAAMEHSKTERALVCPKCHHTVYPRINPAVIVAVRDGERLLLTKYAGRAFTRYALVAGYSEIGETVEETVRREVMEETGLRLGKLHFYKSQPWVVTDSLLMGFYADLEGSDQIKLQEDELSEGTWFRRDEIPDDFSGDSLTGEMITRFRQGLDRVPLG